MTQHYVGRKIVMAWEQDKDGQPGYQVKYSNGHISWSPKDAFDESHLALGHVGQYTYDQQLVLADMVEFSARLEALEGVPGDLADIERGILRLYMDVTQKKVDAFSNIEHEVAV
ncbi:hypothetical protein D3C85_238970 [compost metagenome]